MTRMIFGATHLLLIFPLTFLSQRSLRKNLSVMKVMKASVKPFFHCNVFGHGFVNILRWYRKYHASSKLSMKVSKVLNLCNFCKNNNHNNQ